jgi:hypothetical protein
MKGNSPRSTLLPPTILPDLGGIADGESFEFTPGKEFFWGRAGREAFWAGLEFFWGTADMESSWVPVGRESIKGTAGRR